MQIYIYIYNYIYLLLFFGGRGVKLVGVEDFFFYLRLDEKKFCLENEGGVCGCHCPPCVDVLAFLLHLKI